MKAISLFISVLAIQLGAHAADFPTGKFKCKSDGSLEKVEAFSVTIEDIRFKDDAGLPYVQINYDKKEFGGVRGFGTIRTFKGKRYIDVNRAHSLEISKDGSAIVNDNNYRGLICGLET